MNLSSQQTEAIDAIKKWHADASEGFGTPVFYLSGPAGTGKTTVAKEIPGALGITDPKGVYYGTFTGKAAHVLRSKGANPVSTIHSAIYFPTTSEAAKEALRYAREELADLEETAAQLGALKHEEARLALVTGIGWASVMEFSGALDEGRETVPALEAEARRLSWEWNPDSEWASASLIILDEVSMVGSKLAADVERYEVPIIVLGDPAQLPPVEGGGHYTNRVPDFNLDEIHRQALESPVLELATRIRLSTGEALGMAPADMRPASLREALEADQVLVWSNKRRWAMVNAMRTKLGRPSGQVVPGDRIMCLTNNKEMAVFNGQQFTVLQVTPSTLGPTLLVRTEEGAERTISTYADGFQGQDAQVAAKNSGAGMRGQRMLATFAQAITVHKAQGSEWDHVYIVNETPTMIWAAGRKEGSARAIAQARQWAYTAVTRAAERVTVSAPSRG